MNTENQKDVKKGSGHVESSILQNPLVRKVAIYGSALLAVFLIGFVPVWMTALSRGNDLAAAKIQLKAAHLQNVLSSSVIYSRRGDYEPARISASDFFTSLRAELELDSNSALTQKQRDSIKPLLSQRDEIITLLSRSDPASADRLSDFYVLYRKAFDAT